MTAWRTLFRPPAEHFANALAAPGPLRNHSRTSFTALLGLVLICLVPRVLMAWRVPTVVADGALYIHAAQALDKGTPAEALGHLSLNTYPAILLALHRVGLDWETAGKWWGVLIASLVVAPMYGWARRQFDTQVAAVACLLYAFHPKMIQWSPEVIRDSTFWFLFMLAIYLLWRAVTEVRIGWYAAAGLAACLAALTRFEGLFLAIPLALWSLWRLRALRSCKGRLLVGLVLCLATGPLFILAIGSLVLRAETVWRLLRLDPLGRVWTWAVAVLGGFAPGLGGVAAAHVGEPLSAWRMLAVFFPTMTRGLSPVFALLMFGGMWGWRHVWGRRDHQALFYTGLVVTAAIWIQLWYDRILCPRYALTIVLFATVFAALGLLGVSARLARLALRYRLRSQAVVLAALAPTVLACGVGLADAMTSSRGYFAARTVAMHLGQWARRAFPSPPVIVGPAAVTPIVGHYAESPRWAVFRFDTRDPEVVLGLVKQHCPDLLVVAPTRGLSEPQCQDLVHRARALGFRLVEPGELPPNISDLHVLVRHPTGAMVASRPEQ